MGELITDKIPHNELHCRDTVLSNSCETADLPYPMNPLKRIWSMITKKDTRIAGTPHPYKQYPTKRLLWFPSRFDPRPPSRY